MSQSIQLQVTQVGLEQSIAAAMKRVGSSSQINLGTSSKQINALSQPLGRITGQADEFSKSMAAANARVLAFGASAGIIAGVSKAMSGLLTSTIKVEKSLVEISTVLNKTGSELDKFGQDIFNVAKNTGKSFDEVAKGALELARQGLNAEDTLARLNDALILSRLSGLDAAQSVEGLTAAFNSFKSSGITTAEILNKVVAAAQKYSVSEKDIIEGLKRSASVANLAGVSFEELAALITAVQQKTARGGAVIGNAFKTIFSRIQDKAVLSDLDNMGVAVTNLQGEVLPALRILENLADKMGSISQIEQADIAKKLGGVYQLDKLLAALSDLSDEASVTTGALKAMGEAGSSAYKKNAILNETLAALLNKVAVSAEQLGAKLGEIGVTDSLKNVLGFFNGLLEGIQRILGEESGLGTMVRGLVKGLGNFLAGPGLAIFGAIILKLSKDLVTFGFASLKVFFGIGKAAKEVQDVEGAISQILAKNVNLQQQLFALEGNRAAQLRLITGALVEQEALLRRSANISSGLGAPLYNAGVRARESGLRIGNSAGGYMPAVAKESKAIKQGVGGARAGDKPVVVPNFNFGGGKKGTMVAHTGEYIVPNFNGSGGSAVFNRRMVQSMGLPSGAKKIGAAGGFVPNFAEENSSGIGPKTFLDQFNLSGSENPQQVVDEINKNGYFAEVKGAAIQVYQDANKTNKVLGLKNGINIKSDLSTKLLAVKNSYNAEANPNEAVMLIPQDMPYRISGANTDFTKDNIRKIGNNTYSSFRGATAGVRSNLTEADGKNFEKISKIDTLLEEGLSKAAFSILSEVEPGIKLPDNSPLKPGNIKNVLESGGKGAFGALRGALFETVISQVARAKGRSFTRGSLDIDFEAGDENSRKVIETIFGLPKNKYEFADLKNSIDQKDKYIDQVMTYLPKDQNIALAKKVSSNKGPNAAGGYIPNFVGKSREMGRGVQGAFYKLGEKDGDQVGVKKFFKDGPSKAVEIEWLVSEFLSKYANIPAVFGPKNLSSLADSKRKRSIRKQVVSDPLAKNAVGSDTARMFGSTVLFNALQTKGLSIGDLHGSNYTVNASAENAIDQLRNYPQNSTGALSILRQMASKGARIGIIDSGAAKVSDPARSVIGSILQKESQQAKTAAGGFIPNFAGSQRFVGAKKAAMQITKVMGVALIKQWIDSRLGDGFVDNIEAAGLRKIHPKNIAPFLAELSKPTRRKNERLFDTALMKDPLMQAQFPERYEALLAEIAEERRINSAAGGFLPNFANPLQAAVGREMAAGVPASQIYIDKSPALKNAANPMGLMVANRRDEPAGGFQGINRARREGANPMMYGAAGGFVPNYAAGNDSGGTSKVLATLFLFQTAVSVASGFFEQAGESGRKLSETLQKIASTALIFGGIAFSGPIKRLKEFADEVRKAKNATPQQKQGGIRSGLIEGYQAGRSGRSNRFFANNNMGGRFWSGNAPFTAVSNRYNLAPRGMSAARVGSVLGSGVRSVAGAATSFGRGAAGLFGGVLGPATLLVGGFKVLGESLSGFRTYSNAAAKSLGEMSVYAAKASESLSELDKTAIEAETNKRYGVTAGTLLGSISDITGASALASGISGQQISNTNYRGRNVELSNVSEDTFKQIEKAFITSFVGANRTKFATAEDASGAAAAEFSEKFRNDFDEFDAANIKDEIKTLSEEAQRFKKDNAVAEALKQAKIQSELATRDVINFNNVLGDSANKIIKLKAKIFELKSSNEIFKALSEAGIENASNLSEFEKVAQKLGTTLQSLDASKAVQELDLIAKTTENIDNTIKTNLKGLTVQDVGLGELYSEIKGLITSGNVKGINELIDDKTKGTDITKLFGEDSRTFLQEQTKEFNAQTTEIKNQAKEAQNNANIEAYRSLLAQQTTSALESQTKQLDLQKSSAEKIFEYTEKIRSSTDKISDLNFERGLIGATQRQRLSAQIGRRPELDRRTREASLSNFKQDRVGFVQSLESLIPSTLSAELQLSLKSGILNATKSIREQNTLEDVSKKATDEYNKTIEEINNAVQGESKNRQSYIDKLQDALVGPSVTFGDSVVKAAQEFKRITIEAANIPYENRIKELEEQKGKIKSPTFTEAELDNLNKGKRVLATLEARVEGRKFSKEKDQYLKEFPEIGAAFKKEEEIAKAEQAVKRLDDTITELEKKINNFSPAPSSSGIPFYVQPPDPARLKSSTVVPLPRASQDEANKAREAAQKDQTAAILENTKSKEELSDELQKIDSVARILADEFAQLKDGIPAAIASITSQRNKSISGAEILGANYDLATQEQLRGAQSEEEYNKIIRDRQNKGIGQLFAEEYGKTSEEQALDLKKTIVDGSVQFKNNMIEGIMGAVEGTSSLKDGLRSAAYEFIKMINQKMMSNLVDKVVGGNVESGTGQTGGGIVGFLSNMFASGGKVTGGSGSKDDVPAMLMGGEYVVNKKAVSKYGPQFLEAINNGTLNGYAKGGKVQRGPQGNFYTPGTFGQGAIEGKMNLLDFATQTGTSGKFDQMINESGYQAIDLEPESSRLSVSGMRNSPMFDATQSAKGQAFDLYLQQYNAEREAKKQAKEQKKALIRQVGMLALSAALGPVINAAGSGFSAAFKGADGQGFMSQLGAGFKGIVSGGTVGNQQVGGLSNLFSGAGKMFSGDFAGAANKFKLSQIANGNQLSDLYKSDPKFASYIDSMGGINVSGAPVATNIIPEAGRFSATRANASAPSGAARSGSGIVQYGNVDNAINLGPPPEDTTEARMLLSGVNPLFQDWLIRGGLQGFANGGMIPSTSGIDTVPAMLSGGEFVMNRSAVQSIGAPNLQSMNSGGTSITSEETSKELNEKLLAKLDELIGASGSTGNITINVAPSGQTSQETSQDPSASRQQLARQIKDAVLQIINDEKRIGGSLRR